MGLPQLTLYGSVASPFTEKVELALKGGNIAYNYHSVNLYDKPAFFTEQINPIGKVPAITYGGPDVPPEEPSPQSAKLTESNIILEFLADAYPEAKLMPTDAVQRAKVRFFMKIVTEKYLQALVAWLLDSEPQATEDHLKLIELLQGLIPESGEYAVGDSYTIADACITPFINRLLLSIEYDIGKFPVGNGPKFGELLKDPKYAKFMTYVNFVTTRTVTKENWHSKKEITKGSWNKMFGRDSTHKLSPEKMQGRW